LPAVGVEVLGLVSVVLAWVMAMATVERVMVMVGRQAQVA
jgi:hypothetical protein